MRYVLRVFGLLIVLAAVWVLVTDLAATGEGAGFAPMPLGQLWYGLDPGSLNLVQAVIERYVWMVLWDPVLLTVLQWPAAAVFAGLGGLLLALGFMRGAKGEPEEEPEEV
jgi:hypothetical protein